jgi:hypothetical protein
LALMDMGLATPVRDPCYSALKLTGQVLMQLGVEPERAVTTVRRFAAHDATLLARQQAMHHDEAKLVQSAKDAATELEELLSRDPAA